MTATKSTLQQLKKKQHTQELTMATSQDARDYIEWNGQIVDVTIYDQDAWQPSPAQIRDSRYARNYMYVSNRPWYYFEFWFYPNGYRWEGFEDAPEINIARNTVIWDWVTINCDIDE